MDGEAYDSGGEIMKYLPNYQNRGKGKKCDHVFSVIDERYDSIYQKCIKCFRIFENRVNEY